MLLFKKLCRISGANQQNQNNTSANRNDFNEYNGCHRRRSILQSSDPTINSIPANQSNRVEQECINRVLSRTPPPVYELNCALPESPPPSYSHTQESSNQERRNNSTRNREENPNISQRDIGHLNIDVGGIDVSSDRRSNDVCSSSNSNSSSARIRNELREERISHPYAEIRNEPLRQLRTEHHQHPHQHQQGEQHEQRQEEGEGEDERYRYQRQRQRRRQRQQLHWLQQQQQRRFYNINASSTDSSSSSSSDFELLRTNQRERIYEPRQSTEFLSQRSTRPVQIPRVFRDAYCPDLLHACSLVLNQNQNQNENENQNQNQENREQSETETETSDSSIGNFTNTPQNSEQNIDYVEIGWQHQEQNQRQQQQQRPNIFNSLHCTISTPDLRASPAAAENLQLGNANRYGSANLKPQSVSIIVKKDCDNNSQRLVSREMGQHFSLRRPRISLTWVLREQQQQQQQQQQQKEHQQQEENQQNQTQEKQDSTETKPVDGTNDQNHYNNNNGVNYTSLTSDIGLKGTTTITTTANETQLPTPTPTTKPEPVHLFQTEKPKYAAPKKRYRLNYQLPGAAEPLNGYATTPTGHVPSLVTSISGTQKRCFSSQNLPENYSKENGRERGPSKELYFVCTPQRLPNSYGNGGDPTEILALVKRRNEIQKRFAAKQLQRATADSNHSKLNGGLKFTKESRSPNIGTENATGVGDTLEDLKSLKCPSYSEPSLIAISEGNPRRHRHRKRRDRTRGGGVGGGGGAAQKFGYEINNVDEFLSKCSLSSPGNIPVVLSTSSTLYQTRPGGFQSELPLPLGMVVNAVFKNQNWLYVQTPHAEEGYVGYTCCLPLGILPQPLSSRGAKPTPCWESNVDVFPRPCGNMTDSEKEIRLRGGTRSDGARTPSGKRIVNEQSTTKSNNVRDVDMVNGNIILTKPIENSQSAYGEQQVDRLYLRAASQPKLVEKAYAQLRSIKNASASSSVRMKNTTTTTTTTDEYITLKAQQQQQQQQQQVASSSHLQYSRRLMYTTNGQNSQYFHQKPFSHNPNPNPNQSQSGTAVVALTSSSNTQVNQNALQYIARKQQHQQQHSLRETLVAINMDYNTESISLKKGEIVTLCECRETKDQRQWFYVKARDGREGYIPAEVAGHGFL